MVNTGPLERSILSLRPPKIRPYERTIRTAGLSRLLCYRRGGQIEYCDRFLSLLLFIIAFKCGRELGVLAFRFDADLGILNLDLD